MESIPKTEDILVPEGLARLLTEGEHTLWVGRPRQGIVLRTIDVILIPCSLFAGGFFALWTYFILIKPVPIPIKFLVILAISFAFYLIYGRFLLDARRRSRTLYAITSERSIILDTKTWQVLRSMAHRDQRLNRSKTRTVLFGKSKGWGDMYAIAMGFNPNRISASPIDSAEFELDCGVDEVRKILLERMGDVNDPTRS